MTSRVRKWTFVGVSVFFARIIFKRLVSRAKRNRFSGSTDTWPPVVKATTRHAETAPPRAAAGPARPTSESAAG